MKLSFSNIAWDSKDNTQICSLLSTHGFSALEIAPTIIASDPFTKNSTVVENFAKSSLEKYGLSISSMQSIWFNRTENIFNLKEQGKLLDYTEKIIDLASLINCPNIVFGCPKNRNLPQEKNPSEVIPFFKTLGDYANKKNTCIALEANPTIYHTNFINTTPEAFDFARKVNSNGFKVNVDLGTIIYNHESLDPLVKHADLINHIHISEPNLAPILERPLHQELLNILKSINYQKYLSIEMKNPQNIAIIESIITYVSRVFK